MRKRSHFLAVLLTLVIVISNCFCEKPEVPVSAKESGSLLCSDLRGSNEGLQSYGRWSQPVYSYLVDTGSGFMRVQGNANDKGVCIVYYDKSFKVTSRKELAEELPLFGGFYADDTGYYLVTGQENTKESDKVEVYRITKYTKDWKRVDSASLYGANTYKPFDAGSCRMDKDGQYLIVRTCHKMYKSSDGNNHQANVTIEVDTSSMEITDSHTSVANSSVGYASHSFNEFVKIENHSIVAVEHGDAGPRAIALMKYPTDVTTGQFQSKVNLINVMEFPGNRGDNTTGATVGGFEISKDSYLIAGSSVVQDEKNTTRSTKNVFVASVDKETDEVNINWLTSISEGNGTASTPHLVKISDKSFMVLWTENDRVKYVLVDSTGNETSDTYSIEGKLSDCLPIVSNGKVVWYTWKDDNESFYTISINSLETYEKKDFNYDHEYECTKLDGKNGSFKCKKCGKTVSGEVPVGFKPYWKKTTDTGSYWSNVPGDIYKDDVIVFLNNLDYGGDANSEFAAMAVESSDPEHCILTYNPNEVHFTAGGKYTVKMYLKFNPEISREYTFTVEPVDEQTEVTKAPTPTPTKEPTPTPTKEPTPTPTKEPTPEPTEEPTPEPTKEPTPTPTKEPTPTPIKEEPTTIVTEAPDVDTDGGELYGADFSFKDISSSSTVSFTGDDGRPKIVVLGDFVDCWNTIDMIDTITYYLSEIDLQIFGIDIKSNSADDILETLEYNSLDGSFSCTTEKGIKASGNMDWSEIKQAIFDAGGIKTSGRRRGGFVTPVIAYIDAYGNILKVTTGYIDYDDLYADIDLLLTDGEDDSEVGNRAGKNSAIVSTKTSKNGDVTQLVLKTDVMGGKTLRVTKAYTDLTLEETKYSISGNKAKLTLFATKGNALTLPGYVKLEGKKYYVKYIGKLAFGGNTSVTEITLGKHVTKIYKSAFNGMKNLSVININAAKLKSVGKKAFKGIDKNTVFNITGTKEQFEKAKALIEKSGVASTVTFNWIEA